MATSNIEMEPRNPAFSIRVISYSDKRGHPYVMMFCHSCLKELPRRATECGNLPEWLRGRITIRNAASIRARRRPVKHPIRNSCESSNLSVVGNLLSVCHYTIGTRRSLFTIHSTPANFMLPRIHALTHTVTTCLYINTYSVLSIVESR